MISLLKLSLGIIFFVSTCSWGSIVVTGTRVVYLSDQKEVTVKLNNNGSGPVLVQSWIDNGDPKSYPESVKVPFVLTPPINRVNSGKGQTLRIRYIDDNLPADKESVFYLNILEIPPKKGRMESDNMLQLAFRTRIKLFFRPAMLSKGASSAFKNVRWLQREAKVFANNPTPYYINVAYLSGDKDGDSNVGDGGMIPPYGEREYTLKNKNSKFYPVLINDYGALRAISIHE